MTMTPERLEELEKLAEAATPGHWGVRVEQHGSTVSADGRTSAWCGSHLSEHATNAAFIAASRQAIPELIAEVRALRQDNQRLRDAAALLEATLMDMP